MLDLLVVTNDHYVGEGKSIDMSATAVCLAVCLGHLQQRPMTAQDISNQLRVPRSTVQRKIDMLVKIGTIRPWTEAERRHSRRRCYYLNEDVANSEAAIASVSGILGRIMRGGAAIQGAINSNAANNVQTGKLATEIAISHLRMGVQPRETEELIG